MPKCATDNRPYPSSPGLTGAHKNKIVGSIAVYKSLSISALCLLAVTAHASSTNVPGMANPWLAGMPDGSVIIFENTTDTAPAQSPTLVSGLSLASGAVRFSDASGGVHNGPLCPGTCFGPDGRTFQGNDFVKHDGGAVNGIAGVWAPMNALMGVFLDDTQPDLLTAPAGLDFRTIGLDFLSLAPTLRQVFFIGDGFTSGGTQQEFLVPVGATRLYLGTMDGFGWANNSGAFNVFVSDSKISTVPVPAAGWLLGSALGMLGLGSRKRKQDRG